MANDKTIVDVLSLEGFRSALDARLSEAQSLMTCLTEQLRETVPELGDLPDAQYVRTRYQTLYEQHLERTTRLITALAVARDAITTITDNYRNMEARLTADAADIADALAGVNGVPDGGFTDAR